MMVLRGLPPIRQVRKPNALPKAFGYDACMKQTLDSEDSAAYGFSKDKLPHGLSYPLKRSLLDGALRDRCVYGAVYSVRYLGSRSSVVLDAQFVPIGSRHAHQSVVGRSLITLWAVPSTKRHHLEEQILISALPRLCDWLAQSQRKDFSSWRGLLHSIAFQLSHGELVRTEN